MRLRPLITFFMVLVPVCTFAQTPLTNQNLYDTTATMFEHYRDRVALFEKEPAVKGAIIFLGDSITEGTDWKKATGDSTAINRGIGGDVTFGVLRRLDELARHSPSRIFILIGVNDIGRDVPETVIANNVRKMVMHFQRTLPSTQLFIQTVLPVNPTVNRFPQHYDKQEHVTRLNQLLQLVGNATGVTVIDMGEAVRDDYGRLDAMLTYDGLHLNAKGYERWVALLRAKGYL